MGVLNDPSVLYCLLWNGTTWGAMTDDGWTYGKTLRYPSGTGSPDAEGVTRAEWSSTAIYVVSERDNSAGDVSRMSVLRYDHAAHGDDADRDARVEPDRRSARRRPANAGLEGITWIPDSYLVANGFFDEAANAAYDPGRYSGPRHRAVLRGRRERPG